MTFILDMQIWILSWVFPCGLNYKVGYFIFNCNASFKYTFYFSKGKFHFSNVHLVLCYQHHFFPIPYHLIDQLIWNDFKLITIIVCFMKCIWIFSWYICYLVRIKKYTLIEAHGKLFVEKRVKTHYALQKL